MKVLKQKWLEIGWKAALPYFFNSFLNRYHIKKDLVAPSEFVITRIHCTKDIFYRKHVSYYLFVWMRHGRTLSNKTFRILERFRIIYNKNHSSFNVSSVEMDLFLFKLAICEFFSVKFSKTQKELLQMYFLTS